jgi:nitronate monooxygenase
LSLSFRGIQKACVDYGADIVVTEKISGTPCTVINTPYIQKCTKNLVRKHFKKNKTLKKWVKMIRYMMGSNAVTKAATEVTYNSLGCHQLSKTRLQYAQLLQSWMY